MKIKAIIKKMNCQHCVDKITKTLQKNLKAKKVALDFDSQILTCQLKDEKSVLEMQNLITQLGYEIEGLTIED
ncbi:heavy-metal-associated domain-containing protein [Spiroplasma alleghenense]|uniref:HMA domain-containing protein n=1 Tax=Spiroplasma alleghenense TaxID=216931 RepID=A0A345Z3Q9_9MOLU|nr:heavy metal-associated domain-containing protein [Spiroplasma alleghenense]AXK51238.1 hypothetical protein SALLE_v1c05660 [Spiroplasma alleghenense]